MSHLPSRAHTRLRARTHTRTPGRIRLGAHTRARAYIQNKKIFLQNESGTNLPQAEQNKKQQKKNRYKTTTYKIVEKNTCNQCWGMPLIEHRKRKTFIRVGMKPLILLNADSF